MGKDRSRGRGLVVAGPWAAVYLWMPLQACYLISPPPDPSPQPHQAL